MNSAFLSMMDDAVDGKVDRMCAESGQVTLGELVARLEGADATLPIAIDDGTPPGNLKSYRGFYRFIAIASGNKCTVGEFLERAKDAIGKTFLGYKGGDFTMTKMTPVWVAEYGCSTNVGVIDVKNTADGVVLVTGKIDKDYD